MKRLLLFLMLLLTCTFIFAQDPAITQYKYRVDTSITTKTGPKSITPVTVGSRLKELADLVPLPAIIYVDTVYFSGTNLIYKKRGITYTLPVPGSQETLDQVTTNGAITPNVISIGGLTISSIVSGGPADSVLVITPSGQVRRRAYPTSAGSVTASNGLTLLSGDIKLGGVLNKNTDIELNAFRHKLTNTNISGAISEVSFNGDNTIVQRAVKNGGVDTSEINIKPDSIYINSKRITFEKLKNNGTEDSVLALSGDGVLKQKKINTISFYTDDGTFTGNRTVDGNTYNGLTFNNLFEFNANMPYPLGPSFGEGRISASNNYGYFYISKGSSPATIYQVGVDMTQGDLAANWKAHFGYRLGTTKHNLFQLNENGIQLYKWSSTPSERDTLFTVSSDDGKVKLWKYLNNEAEDSVLITDAEGNVKLKKIEIDTTSLSFRIDQKLNISDTLDMLSSYLRKVDTMSKWKPLGWTPVVSEVIGLQDSLNDRYTKDQSDTRYLQGNQTITLSGDVLGSGTTAITTTIDPAYASFTNYYTKTNLQISGQAAVHWGNLTNVPASFPTTSNLQTVLANGNTANNSITLGGTGVPINYSYRLGRLVGSEDRVAAFDIFGDAILGYGARIFAQGAGGSGTMRSLSIIDNAPTVYFSPDAGVNDYQIWHENNHPAGSAFTMTYSGAEVPATATYNSSGHTTAQTKRNLTAGDIDAVSRTPSTVSWNDYIISGSAALMASSTGAPNANPWYGFSTGPDANNAAQFAMRGTDAYFRTRLGGVTGAWTPLATQSWVTSNFAPAVTGGYIQNQNASAQSGANFRIAGSGQADAGLVTNAGIGGGTAAHVQLRTGNSARWSLGLAGAESGSNGGSDFNIWRYSDAGSFIGSVLSINRASGSFQFGGILSGTSSLLTNSVKTIMPNLSGIAGSGSGTANVAWFGFYESNGTTRQGYIGKGSNGNDDIYLLSDIGNINLNATGIVALNSTTKNHLYFNANGIGAPTFTTRSVGTKVVVYPSLNTTNVDFAHGVESNYQWYSVPQNITSNGFKWYGGTTEVARLSGTGQLSVNTSVTSPLLTAPSGSSLSLTAPASQSIFFNPGGSNYGVWDDAGRLGIGTIPNPVRSSLLEVNGNIWATDAYLLGTGSTPVAELFLTGSDAGLRTMSTQNFVFNTNADTERMRIDGTSGNVLIGTSTDNNVDKLQVNGSARVQGFTAGVITITGNLTVIQSNYTIINRAISGNPTVTLPNPGGVNLGRIIVLVEEAANVSANGMNYEMTGGVGVYYKGSTYRNALDWAAASLPVFSRLTVQSDGTNWVVISATE